MFNKKIWIVEMGEVEEKEGEKMETPWSHNKWVGPTCVFLYAKLYLVWENQRQKWVIFLFLSLFSRGCLLPLLRRFLFLFNSKNLGIFIITSHQNNGNSCEIIITNDSFTHILKIFLTYLINTIAYFKTWIQDSKIS